MEINEFIDGLVVAIDLPGVSTLELSKPICEIPDFDSLATLGVMTYCSIEFDKEIDGMWIWDNKITPEQLLKHLSS